jgi:Met-10+ like-protein
VSLKSLIYRSGLSFLRLTWRVKGGRKLTAFGHDLLLTYDTIFPSYRKFRLPKGGCLSEIVRYADYVQLHAICNFVSQLGSQPVIIDIGAHHGAYAILVGQIVRHLKGKVIAMEPNPEAFDVLKNNIRLNRLEDIVICEQVAVSDKAGLMHLKMEDSQSHIESRRATNNIPVNVITLAH